MKNQPFRRLSPSAARIEEYRQSAQNRFSHEGESAAERAKNTRSLGRNGYLRAHSGGSPRAAPLRSARRSSLRQWCFAPWARPEQMLEGFHRQVQEHGRTRCTLRSGLGLSWAADRDKGRPAAWEKEAADES